MNEKATSSFKATELVYNLRTLLPVLVKTGEISRRQAEKARELAGEHGYNLDHPGGFDFLIKLGLKRQHPARPGERVGEEAVLRSMGKAHGLRFKRVDRLELDLDVTTKTISESFARTNMLVPLRVSEGRMELLVHNPFRPQLWEDMGRVSPLPYTVFLGTRSDISRLIEDFFQFRLAIKAAELEFAGREHLGDMEGRVQVGQEGKPSTQKHIIQAVDHLMSTALRERASDLHLEPKRNHSEVRFRIDGVLHTLYQLPLSVHRAMISRIKSLSRLDIAEKRRPQDGRIQLVLNDIPTDVRISTIPVAFGEKMVLRLLSSSSTLKPLDQLGMTASQLNRFNDFLRHTHGLILVTGPTGSGKSTTLYSALKSLVSPTINMVTVEDPVEMVVEDFNQIGVQTKIGVTFAQMLRHILRQDPDIIMIGEMRDLETAEQAVQAALTGHLVFSTLHTNDATSTLTRLLDLGLDNYLVNAALIGVVAQRLVRTICPRCRVSYSVDSTEIKNLGLEENFFDISDDRATLWKGVGCEYCRMTGFRGRTGIFEILPFDQEIKETFGRRREELSKLRNKVKAKGVQNLLEAGLSKVRRGVTTLEEVLRVVGPGTGS